MNYYVDIAVKIVNVDGDVEYENVTGEYAANSKLLAAHKCFQEYRRAFRSFDKSSELTMIEYTAKTVINDDDENDDDNDDVYHDDIELPKSNLMSRLCYDIFKVCKVFFTMIGISTAAAIIVYCFRYASSGFPIGAEQYIVLTCAIIGFALTMIAGYGIINHIMLNAYRRICNGSSSALASTISKILTTLIVIPAFYGVCYICMTIVFFGIINAL